MYLQVLLVQHQTPGDREPFGYPFEILVDVRQRQTETEADREERDKKETHFALMNTKKERQE